MPRAATSASARLQLRRGPLSDAPSTLLDRSARAKMQHSVSVRAPQQPSVRTRALRAAAGTSALRCPPRAASGRRLRAACSAAAAVEPVPVMVNGITGKMGFATAEAALQRGLRLLPVAFSGALLPRGAACGSVADAGRARSYARRAERDVRGRARRSAAV